MMKSKLLQSLVVVSLLAHLFYLFVHDDGPRTGSSSGSSWRSWGNGSSGGGGGYGGFGGGHK